MKNKEYIVNSEGSKIHVLTINTYYKKWVDVNYKYVNRYLNNFKIWAILDGFDDSYYEQKKGLYHYCGRNVVKGTEPMQGEKYNFLAKKVISDPNTNDNDVLLFIDSDAFPIKPLNSFIKNKLKRYPLVAIQRKEQLRDSQPHTSFCFTTVKLWKDIKGDWRPGYKWKTKIGYATDCGGNLLKILMDNNINWYKMLRTNKKNYHPLFFAVYDNLVYHHGAGNRYPKLSKADMHYLSPILNRLNSEKRNEYMRKYIAQLENVSDEIIEDIKHNFKFYKRFEVH